jgi:hypothetical protein
MSADFLDLARLGGRKARQVTTHSHDRPHPKFPDRNHRDWVHIEPGSTYAFPEVRGPGALTCLWTTLAPGSATNLREAVSQNLVWKFLRYRNLRCLRDTWLKIRFDGEREPRVAAPLGDFFGTGFGQYRHFQSALAGMTSGGYYAYFPMPFRESCRVEVENTRKDQAVTFYGAATFTSLPGPRDDLAYFHASYRREAQTRPGAPYPILETRGPGRFLGCAVNMEAKRKRDWFLFMEGNLDIHLDGEPEPSIEYTGTEDYFMGGWYFNKGTFSAPYHGLTQKSWRRFRISAYRFHVPDPIEFASSIRVLLHHGEFDEVAADYSSVAYWYAKP